jgi:hypothetical protein
MSAERRQHIANAAAEELLRLIYGDDLAGCTVSVDTLSSVIAEAMATEGKLNTRLLDLYEKSNEAVQALSRAPAPAQVSNPVELQALLSDRLDTIHALSQKLASLTAAAKAPGALVNPPPEAE